MSEYERVIIHDMEERNSPASMPVLQVVLVGNHVFLTIASLEETNKVTTLTNIADIAVDKATLLSAVLGVPDSLGVSHVEESRR
jgi:hypothetical protein